MRKQKQDTYEGDADTRALAAASPPWPPQLVEAASHSVQTHLSLATTLPPPPLTYSSSSISTLPSTPAMSTLQFVNSATRLFRTCPGPAPIPFLDIPSRIPLNRLGNGFWSIIMVRCFLVCDRGSPRGKSLVSDVSPGKELIFQSRVYKSPRGCEAGQATITSSDDILSNTRSRHDLG